jgi:hypothetical protein
MTPISCIQSCRANGYKYAGLQYGRQVCPDAHPELTSSVTVEIRCIRTRVRIRDVRWHVLEMLNRFAVETTD